MAIATLEDARLSLRVDSYFDDETILRKLATAEAVCSEVAKLSAEEWNAISNYSIEDKAGLTIRSEVKSHAEIMQIRDLLHEAVLFALTYLYEHREEADHHNLKWNLRNLLSALREGYLL